MKIQKLKIKNYTSINDINIEFDEYYTAICGQNNAGKSNILSAIEVLFGRYSNYPKNYPRYMSTAITNRYSIPNWATNTEEPMLEMEIIVSKETDSEIFENNPDILPDEERAVIKIIHNNKKSPSILLNGSLLESTDSERLMRDIEGGLIRYDSAYSHNIRDHSYMEISESARKSINQSIEQINKSLNNDLKNQTRALKILLGFFNEKYNVTLSTPYGVNIDRLVPYEINLGDKKDNHMSLDLWGGGTQNQTLILDAIFKAKRKQASRNLMVCPVLIIEEPESFLHPSAQIKFGQLLQSLAKDLKMQIIVATHSLYMLSLQNPNSNLLVERREYRNQLRESRIVSTGGDEWFLPFNSILGESEALGKFHKDFIFSTSNVLYVEGEIDKQYINIFIEEGLVPDNFQVIPIDGASNILNNIQFLKIIKKHSNKRAFLLDKDMEKEKYIKQIRAEGIGVIFAGTNDTKMIEGLLSDELRKQVVRDNPDVADRATHDRSMKNEMKQLKLKAFKQSTDKDKFKKFKPIIAAIKKFFSPDNI